MSEFEKNGELLRNSVNTAIDNFKVTYFSLENKNLTKKAGGCFIKDEETGNPTINMKKLDNNLYTDDACKLNAGLKQYNHLQKQVNGPVTLNQVDENKESIYYSLVERDSNTSSKGYYECYISDSMSEKIEDSSDTFKEVTIWEAFNENEKHLIQPGNYAYYRNGALFICDKNGNILKQFGNTIDQPATGNPNEYYMLKDNEKKCYGGRYSDIA